MSQRSSGPGCAPERQSAGGQPTARARARARATGAPRAGGGGTWRQWRGRPGAARAPGGSAGRRPGRRPGGPARPASRRWRGRQWCAAPPAAPGQGRVGQLAAAGGAATWDPQQGGRGTAARLERQGTHAGRRVRRRRPAAPARQLPGGWSLHAGTREGIVGDLPGMCGHASPTRAPLQGLGAVEVRRASTAVAALAGGGPAGRPRRR